MLDESPDSLIYAAIDNFETQPDIASLHRISETLKKTTELRNAKTERLQKDIQILENELAELTNELKLLHQPGATMHETLGQMGNGQKQTEEQNVFKIMNNKSVELDNLKVALAKQLTDLESSINQLNMAKLNLSRQSEDLASQKEQALSNNIADNFNSSSMKISLYKLLGVHVEDFDTQNDKIIMFDKLLNLTSVLQVDEKYSDYFISNYIWDRLGNET